VIRTIQPESAKFRPGKTPRNFRKREAIPRGMSFYMVRDETEEYKSGSGRAPFPQKQGEHKMRIEDLAKQQKEHAEEAAKLAKQLKQAETTSQTGVSTKSSLAKLKAKL
jgi:hypothetical protein